MSITVAKNAGFCFGVRRAMQAAQQAATGQNSKKVFTAGPIIHNAFAVAQLESLGVFAETPQNIPNGATVVVRAHGITLPQLELLHSKNCEIVDATCPFVTKIHNIVQHESERGNHILIIGKPDHPEVLGIASRCNEQFTVADTWEKIEEFVVKFANKPFCAVCQTTFSKEKYVEFVKKLKNTCNYMCLFDTMCNATVVRQTEAQQQAARSDMVIVIGDEHSSNSLSLYKLCKGICPNTHFIQSAAMLDTAKPSTAKSVFITAGASVPDLIIEEVVHKMSEEMKNGQESFEELLEQSLKTLHTGEKVTGIVTQINATDITVDLGVKQAGYIPLTELSDEPNYVVADNIKVGDEIEAFVVRVNDVEGVIMLSKKRLDAVKNWEVLEAAVESKEALDGIVIDQNKGGVVALVKGIRVFIPASQTGLPRDASFDEMMKTTHKMRITEVNRQRRRIVGSIKAVTSEARREAQTKIWETIEEGKRYNGVVKSFTSYGAFVDIGGVDGMVHISELSWSRIKHPSEILTIGQEVEVYVIGFDTEKRKISLGYKDSSANPWTKFTETYQVDDVANVKIVKYMPFGVFAEVLPGVDGLIHISQLSDKRIAKPEDAVKIGEMVDVKIIGIDDEKKKISLSIRALLEPAYSTPSEAEQPEAE